MRTSLSTASCPIRIHGHVALAEHELWNRWLLMSGDFRDGEHRRPAFAVGYAYVDHYAGTTLWVVAFLDPLTRKVLLRPQEDRNEMVRIRYSPGWESAAYLTADEHIALGLPDEPEGMFIYRRPHLKGLRQNRTLDHLRAPGFPDDLQVEFDGETMWCRVEGIREDGRLTATLRNTPRLTKGLSFGDEIVVAGVQGRDRLHLFWERDPPTLEP